MHAGSGWFLATPSGAEWFVLFFVYLVFSPPRRLAAYDSVYTPQACKPSVGVVAHVERCINRRAWVPACPRNRAWPGEQGCPRDAGIARAAACSFAAILGGGALLAIASSTGDSFHGAPHPCRPPFRRASLSSALCPPRGRGPPPTR